VKADLPGVDKEGLDVRVENNLLTIRLKAAKFGLRLNLHGATDKFHRMRSTENSVQSCVVATL
jgi:HSP20 family molecular chaperone IbpA